LQQVSQDLSLQQSEQVVPAALRDATANSANAMVVRIVFIIFLSLSIFVLELPAKPDTARDQALARGGGVGG
jgi:heme/copper-type cytochrome/quinol oxidase subunit 2